MTIITAREAKKKLSQLVAAVNIGFNPITIVGKNGKNAVLISEEEWNNIEETLYLSGIPGFVNNIKYISKSEDWDNAEVFKP